MKKYIFMLMVVALVLAVSVSTACIKKPAEFTVSDLVLTPAEAEVWQEVTASAKISNIGQIEGTCNATLKIDGAAAQTKAIPVAGGATETVTFTFKRDVGPSCNIEINGLTKTLVVREGVLPTLSIGDKWVNKLITGGLEYTMTLEVTGEDVTDGKNCYVMQGSFDPPFQGMVSTASVKYDKATMQEVRTQMSGVVKDTPFVAAVTYSYEVSGPAAYPAAVGKEHKVVMTMTTTTTVAGQTQTQTTKTTHISKVEGMEEITVPAGTFRCFKIVRHDEQGNLVSTSWSSDKTKTNVKTVEHKTGGSVTELISYSVH